MTAKELLEPAYVQESLKLRDGLLINGFGSEHVAAWHGGQLFLLGLVLDQGCDLLHHAHVQVHKVIDGLFEKGHQKKKKKDKSVTL